jgi:hypothetical protein
VSRKRILILGGIIVVVGFIVYHAVSPWAWTGQLKVPKGVPDQSLSYSCGPPWGSGYVHGPATTAYPLDGTPCGQRGQYQIMIGVDVVIGIFAVSAMGLWSRTRHRPVPT